MTPGAQVVDPVTAEFFTGEGTETPADALVRETIQNSLDARAPSQKGPVRVRYTLTAEGRPEGFSSRWLSGLEGHLRAKKSGLSAASLPTSTEPVSVLLVEDYGTTGLTGDPAQWNNVTDEWENKNNFFFFWRAVGATGKGEGERGSWGLGKSVLPASSRINSILGVSCQGPASGLRLFGLSVLKHHAIDGSSDVHVPYGYFGRHSPPLSVALPIETSDVVDEFCHAFGVTRRAEPGLSVVILYPHYSFAGPSLISSVIVHYFLPILAGQLVVEVKAGDRLYTLDADSIEQRAKEVEPFFSEHGMQAPAVYAALALARWSIEHRGVAALVLAACSDAARLQWDDNVFAIEGWNAARQQFNEGKPVAFAITVRVAKKNREPEPSVFYVTMQSAPAEQRALTLYVREGITIRDVKSQVTRGLVAFATVDSRPLAAFLRGAENPAHTSWRASQGRLTEIYDKPKLLLSFVTNSIGAIHERLNRTEEGIDVDCLIELFSLDEDAEDGSVKSVHAGKRGSSPQTPKIPKLAPAADLVAIAATANGVVLNGGTAGSAALNNIFTVKFAYDVRRGNPFTKWSAHDFALDDPSISVRPDGVTLIRVEDNLLEFVVNRPDFTVHISGLDQSRDLKVEARLAQ